MQCLKYRDMFHSCVACFYWFCVWYFSNVFKCVRFFLSIFMMSILSVMVPYVCPMFSIWFEYPNAVIVPECLYMLFISSVELSLSLSCLLQWAVESCQLVNATFAVFICLGLGFYYVLYCVLCSKCYFYLCFFKKFCNFPCFLPLYIWK
jgi:hypothetical protein